MPIMTVIIVEGQDFMASMSSVVYFQGHRRNGEKRRYIHREVTRCFSFAPNWPKSAAPLHSLAELLERSEFKV